MSATLLDPSPPDLALASRGGRVLRVLRRSPSAQVGATIVGAFVLIATLAPIIAPYGLQEQVGRPFASPTGDHWLGLDDGGIDMVTLLMWGARVSLFVGFVAGFIAITIGTIIGFVSGYWGGRTDTVLMRGTDYFLVIPDVPLMIVIAALWGPSTLNLVLVIGLLLWTWTARLIRAQVKTLRSRAHVKRARALGMSDTRIILRHILPYIAPLIVANSVLTIAVAIFDETALSFLGLGDPARASWGKLLRNAFERNAISQGAWWSVVPPGVCIALVILGCTLVGQAAEDGLNPRLRISHLAGQGFRVGRRSKVS